MKKSAIFLTMLFVLSMLSTISTPNGIAGIDSMRIFLFIEERDVYIVNDTVNITVHVFDKDGYITPDNLTVTVVGNETNVVPMTEKDIGIYEGAYTLKESDALLGGTIIKATAIYGNNQDSCSPIYITIHSSEISEEFMVLVKLVDHSDYTAQPGDIVEITVTVSNGDARINPDTFELFTAYWGKGSVPIDYTNPSTGVFRTNVIVDPTIKEDTILTIGASASYGESEDSNYVDIPINFYNVWFHKTYIENTSAKFEIWVSTLEGRAVPGAFVYLTEPNATQKTTNSEGKAEFIVNYEEPEFGDIDVVGSVIKDEKTQTFEKKFSTGKIITLPLQPQEGKFDVFYMWGEESFEPGSEINRGYVAYNDTKLWRNETIYYYTIYRQYLTSNFGEVISFGNKVTASNGTFNISFTAPGKEGVCTVIFETATDPSNLTNDGKFYKEHSDPLITIGVGSEAPIYDENIKITMDKLKLSRRNAISVSMSGSSSYLGTLRLEIDDENWTLLSGMKTSYLRNNGEKFSGEIIIPEFLPREVNYTVYATLTDPVTMKYYTNYLVITPSEAAPMELGIVVAYLAILIIVLALIAIIIVYRWKRRKEEESEDLEEEFE